MGDPAADALLDDNAMALLIGMLVDQQVRVQTALARPPKLMRPAGHRS